METPVIVALIGIAGTCLGLGGTFGGIFLGAYLNRKSAISTALHMAEIERHKYAQTRLWDAKKEALTHVISEINGLNLMVDGVIEILFDPDVDPYPYTKSENYSRDHGDIWSRMVKVSQYVEDSSLILTNEFSEKFKEFRAGFSKYDEDTEEREIALIQGRAINVFKPALIELAKNELAALPR